VSRQHMPYPTSNGSYYPPSQGSPPVSPTAPASSYSSAYSYGTSTLPSGMAAQQNYHSDNRHSDDPIPAGQQQNQDTSAATQNCLCPICSRIRDADHDMTGGTIIYQDPSLPVVPPYTSPLPCLPSDCDSSQESVDPYANQNVGGAHPASSAATVFYPTQAWSVVPQPPVCTQILCSAILAEPSPAVPGECWIRTSV
jgi:hypothetical protein